MTTVMMSSGGGTVRPFATFESEEEAIRFVNDNHFEWEDENGFVWELFVEEE